MTERARLHRSLLVSVVVAGLVSAGLSLLQTQQHGQNERGPQMIEQTNLP